MDITFTRTELNIFGKGSDIFIEKIAGGHYNAEVGGRVYEHSPYADRNGNPYSRPTTPAHEFGHLIGLSHRRNVTNSILSYAGDRSVRFVDLKRISDAYANK